MLYKLTDNNRSGQSRRLRWGENITHRVSREGRAEKPLLCSQGVIHLYRHPLLAALVAFHLHVVYWDPILWAAKGKVVVDDGLKVGVRQATTLYEVPMPYPSADDCVRWAVRCAQLVVPKGSLPVWEQWAANLLSNVSQYSGLAAERAANISALTNRNAPSLVSAAACSAAYAASQFNSLDVALAADSVARAGLPGDPPLGSWRSWPTYKALAETWPDLTKNW